MDFVKIFGTIFIATIALGATVFPIALIYAYFRPVFRAVRNNRNYTSLTQEYFFWNKYPSEALLKKMDIDERLYVRLLRRKRK